MTDQQIAEQIQNALLKSIQSVNLSDIRTSTDFNKAVAAEFLPGANQVANFLVKTYGEVTPQQIERALKIVGEGYGFKLHIP